MALTAADRVPVTRIFEQYHPDHPSKTGLLVYKELIPMKKEQVDLQNAMVWIPDSKTPNWIAEVPLTDLARDAF